MNCAIEVQNDGKAVLISNLLVSNSDFAAVMEAHPKTNRQQAALDVIAVGSAAMRRVQTTMDVDFVEKRFSNLSAAFERALTTFEKKALESLSKRFSPTEAGSYTKYIGDLVSTARKDVQGWTTQMTKHSDELLDPDKKTSAVGRLEKMIADATDQFEEMFDPEYNGSYAHMLNEHLSEVFGNDGRPGTLGTSLSTAIQPILKELHELKEKIEVRKATEQLIGGSTLKGRPFEEQVHARLAALAQPFGDDVLLVANGNGGTRAGDFLVTLNGSGRSLVLEARDRKQMSLPAIKGDLDRERTERQADLAIYVSSGPQMLPQHVGDFQVFDDKIITTVDNLHIAYRMARLMAISRGPEGEIDINSIQSALAKIRDTASSLRNVRAKATQIRKLTDGIHTDVECTEEKLAELLEEAEDCLKPKENA